MTRPPSDRHEWESLEAVADRMQHGLDNGCAVIWLEGLTELETRFVTTIARQQIHKKRREQRQAEKAANEQYRGTTR